MALTTAQLSALKADIAASEFSGLAHTPDNAFLIANAYNTTASPDFTVWRTNVSTHEAKTAMVWTEFIGRSQGERDAWQFMLANGTINASDPNVRQGVQDIFSGPSGATSRANLVAVAKRLATRAEKLYAVGVGSTASPATMAVEGFISLVDVQAAWDLP
jgi:hypothetical protein